MKRFSFPAEVLYICDTLRKAGYEAFVVGGSVRDALLGRIPKDWDVATDAPPSHVQRLFPRTVATGIEFGTVTVLVARTGADPTHSQTGEEVSPETGIDARPDSNLGNGAKVAAIEVTTFRGESGYADGRRPDEVHFIGSIEEDLVRRDFTVNAIAYDPFTETVVDPHGGRHDLQRRLIRAVGDADDRFGEDALRILRAIRLATELGFEIEPDTGSALQRNAPGLGYISRERIGQEWRRVIIAPSAGRGLGLLDRFGLLPYMFVTDNNGPVASEPAAGGAPSRRVTESLGRQTVPSTAVIRRVAAALDRLYAGQHPSIAGIDGRDDLVTPTAIVLHGLGSEECHKSWLRNLVYSRKNLQATLLITEALSRFAPHEMVADGDLRRFLSQLGRENIWPFLLAWRALYPGEDEGGIAGRAARIVADGDPLATEELALRGQDVLTIVRVAPGPVVGELLERLLEHVLVYPEDNKRERLTTLLLGWAEDDLSSPGST